MLGVLLPSSRRVDGVVVAALSRLHHTGKEVVRTRMEQLQALDDAQDAAASAKKPVPEEVTKKDEQLAWRTLGAPKP